LLYDRDTGRPKGFGFAEYQDSDMAASAVRNLNDYEIMNRKLRVDFSHDAMAAEMDNNSTSNQINLNNNRNNNNILNNNNSLDMSQQNNQQQQSNPSTQLPPLPAGTDVPPNLSAPDAISRTLSTLPPTQLLDVLSQMKGLVTADPIRASELLRQAPQLSYAIFQALLLMNLVDSSVLSQVIETATAAPSQPTAAAPPIPLVPQAYQPQQQVQQQQQQYNQYQAPPPVPMPAAAAAQQPSIQDAQKAALIQQVMAMTPDQIRQLPVEQQSAIMMLKQQFAAGGGF